MTKRQRGGHPDDVAEPPPPPPPPPLPVDDFRHTDDYRRYLVKYIDPVSLMSLRAVDKAWQIVVDQRIDGLVKGGSLLVHGGNDISDDKAYALEEKRLIFGSHSTCERCSTG